MLLREIASGDHSAWRDSLVLLFAPIYNADGNERVGLDNRPDQLGPVGGMGQRPNAQGFDLNRDYMKLETPEARSLIRLFTEYDPHVTIDLHTTNGTYHGYHLTYSPPLHPGTDPGIASFARGRWLPDVTAALAPEWAMWHYGNLPQDDGFDAPRGWYTFGHQPRFGSNYEGLRNRSASCRRPIRTCPSRSGSRSPARSSKRFSTPATRDADDASAQVVGRRRRRAARSARGSPSRAKVERAAQPVDVLMGGVSTRAPPAHRADHAAAHRRAPGRADARVRRLRGGRHGDGAHAYLVPAALERVVDLLDAHGVRTTPLTRRRRRSRSSASRNGDDAVAERAFQGHRERKVTGAWQAERAAVPAGRWS